MPMIFICWFCILQFFWIYLLVLTVYLVFRVFYICDHGICKQRQFYFFLIWKLLVFWFFFFFFFFFFSGNEHPFHWYKDSGVFHSSLRLLLSFCSRCQENPTHYRLSLLWRSLHTSFISARGTKKTSRPQSRVEFARGLMLRAILMRDKVWWIKNPRWIPLVRQLRHIWQSLTI
jgi:hypothetical protein